MFLGFFVLSLCTTHKQKPKLPPSRASRISPFPVPKSMTQGTHQMGSDSFDTPTQLAKLSARSITKLQYRIAVSDYYVNFFFQTRRHHSKGVITGPVLKKFDFATITWAKATGDLYLEQGTRETPLRHNPTHRGPVCRKRGCETVASSKESFGNLTDGCEQLAQSFIKSVFSR